MGRVVEDFLSSFILVQEGPLVATGHKFFSPPSSVLRLNPSVLYTKRRRQSPVPFSGHYPMRSVDAAQAVVRVEESNRLGSGIRSRFCARLPTWRCNCTCWLLLLSTMLCYFVLHDACWSVGETTDTSTRCGTVLAIQSGWHEHQGCGGYCRGAYQHCL